MKFRLGKKADPKLTWLRELLPFRFLDEETLAMVAKFARREVRSPGTKLTIENSFGHEAYVISRGEVKIMVGDEVIDTIRGGDYLGEMSMIAEPTRTATAIARTSVELAVFDRRDFQHLLSHVPVLREQVEAVASARRRRITG